jgi:hypothetical protein
MADPRRDEQKPQRDQNPSSPNQPRRDPEQERRDRENQQDEQRAPGQGQGPKRGQSLDEGDSPTI